MAKNSKMLVRTPQQKNGTMSGNLELINKPILLPVLENTFFHQSLALEVKNQVLFFRMVHVRHTLPHATPPIGKIQPFSKMAIFFMGF